MTEADRRKLLSLLVSSKSVEHGWRQRVIGLMTPLAAVVFTQTRGGKEKDRRRRKKREGGGMDKGKKKKKKKKKELNYNGRFSFSFFVFLW